MNEETKQALDNAYDIIAEMIDHINNYSTNASETREIINKARGVKDEINDELYKTL